jgi:hypothetical protein
MFQALTFLIVGAQGVERESEEKNISRIGPGGPPPGWRNNYFYGSSFFIPETVVV